MELEERRGSSVTGKMGAVMEAEGVEEEEEGDIDIRTSTLVLNRVLSHAM